MKGDEMRSRRRGTARSDTRITRTTPRIQHEVKHIIESAVSGQVRVVGLGPLIFFSTPAGDAWLLDHEDGRALCLTRQGLPQKVNITETATDFAIEWTASYRITRGTMTIQDDSGQVVSVHGCPTDAILHTIRLAIWGARGAG